MVDRNVPRERQRATKPYKLPDGSYTRIPMNRTRPHPSKLGPKEKSVIYPKRFPLGSKSNPTDGKTPSPRGKSKTGGGFTTPRERPATKNPNTSPMKTNRFGLPKRKSEITKKESARIQALNKRLGSREGSSAEQNTKTVSNLRNFLGQTTAKQRNKENKQGITRNEAFQLHNSGKTGRDKALMRKYLGETNAAQRKKKKSPSPTNKTKSLPLT